VSGGNENRGRQLAFYLDQDGCINCRSCQMACKDLHDLPVGVNWRRVTTLEEGRYPDVVAYHLSMACNHCAEPPCVDVCPTGALEKRVEDGVVTLDADLCGGCRACIAACPYDAPQYDETTGKVGKCDFCLDFVAQGEPPTCIAACIMRVLHFGEVADFAETRGPRIAGLPDPAPGEPAFRVTPHRKAKPPGSTRS
jgi:anaerobic dimethyl sulfoxide reductase subunit B